MSQNTDSPKTIKAMVFHIYTPYDDILTKRVDKGKILIPVIHNNTRKRSKQINVVLEADISYFTPPVDYGMK